MDQFAKHILLISLLISISAAISAAEDINHVKQHWNGALSLRDVQGANNFYHAFIQIKKEPASWTEEELLLVTTTFQLRSDIKGFYTLLQKLCRDQKEYKEKILIIYEKCAWTTLFLAIQSPHPKIRFDALQAAVRTNDIQAISIISKALFDENIAIREYALQLAHFFPDRSIQQIIKEIAKKATREIDRVEAVTILQDQEAVEARDLLSELSKNRAFHEYATIPLLQIEEEEKKLNGHIPIALATQFAHSSREEEQKALLHYAEKRRSKELIDLIIDNILLKKEISTDILLYALTIVGCNKDLIERDDPIKLQKIIHKVELYSTPSSLSTDLLLLRALWFLSLFKESQEKAHDALLKIVQSQKNGIELIDLIAHIRALGTSGVEMATTLFDFIAKKEALVEKTHFKTAQIKTAQMTLALYLLEQNQKTAQNMALFLLENLISSKDESFMFDTHLGAPFEVIIENKNRNTLLNPMEKEIQELEVLERIMKAILRIKPDSIPPEQLLSLFLEKKSFIYRLSSVQFLANHLPYSVEEVTQKIEAECTDDDKKIGFALVLAEMGESDRAIELITAILENPQSSKNRVEAGLYALSQFEISRTERAIAPFLFHSTESIRVRAAESFLVSLNK